MDLHQSELWAVTCYFDRTSNPFRRRNYDAFRSRLGIPLVTVELAHEGDPFQLGEGDADILISLRTDHVLWQTERMFNVAIAAVPPQCRKIAWIDTDMVFLAEGWVESTARALDRHALVQLFERLHDQPSPGPVDTAKDRATGPAPFSAAARFASSPEDREALVYNVSSQRPRGRVVAGGAWAARREILEQHGLYDACVLAGNDRAMLYAATGWFDLAVSTWKMNERQRAHYLDWAVPFHAAVDRSIGVVAGDAMHLWHGDPCDRAGVPRYDGLSAFDFDPASDLGVEAQGTWRWNSQKPDLHAYVRQFMQLRETAGRKPLPA